MLDWKGDFVIGEEAKTLFPTATPTALWNIAPGCPSAGYLGFEQGAPQPRRRLWRAGLAHGAEGRLPASSTCPRHNPLRGWERGAFSQGSLGRQPLAPFLSRHQHLSRKARRASLQNTVGVPDQKTCRRIGQTPDRPQMRAARPAFSCNESSHHRDEVSTLSMKKRAFVPQSDPLARFGGEAGFRRNLLRTRYIEHADPSAIDSGTRNANPSFN